MTNLQFRNKTDFVGLCGDEIKQISISFDTGYRMNLHITKFN